MRSFFVIMVILMCQTCFAQSKGKSNNATKNTETNSETTEKSVKKYKGIVLAKSWTKSTQSYCAQGSEYFVLKVGKEEFVLENQTNLNLADFKGKKVSFSGYEKTRTITPKDDGSQRPVQRTLDANGNEVTVKEASFTCTVLIIEKKL